MCLCVIKLIAEVDERCNKQFNAFQLFIWEAFDSFNAYINNISKIHAQNGCIFNIIISNSYHISVVIAKES